jgi:hypothetical protein
MQKEWNCGPHARASRLSPRLTLFASAMISAFGFDAFRSFFFASRSFFVSISGFLSFDFQSPFFCQGFLSLDEPFNFLSACLCEDEDDDCDDDEPSHLRFTPPAEFAPCDLPLADAAAAGADMAALRLCGSWVVDFDECAIDRRVRQRV